MWPFKEEKDYSSEIQQIIDIAKNEKDSSSVLKNVFFTIYCNTPYFLATKDDLENIKWLDKSVDQFIESLKEGKTCHKN